MESLGGGMPSCWMCHQSAIIPPGAAIGVEVMSPNLVEPSDKMLGMGG